MRTLVTRATWLVFGFVALALGALGVILPLLPTTPFLLVAAFAFAQSSDRLHTWLVEHNIFGPLILNWRKHRAISRRAKVTSLLAMAAIVVISIYIGVPTTMMVIQTILLGASALFVVTRPEPPDP